MDAPRDTERLNPLSVHRVFTLSTEVPKLILSGDMKGDDGAARNYLSGLRIADARPQDNNYFARLLQRERGVLARVH